MKQIFPAGCLAVTLWAALWAQAPGRPEALSAWPYFKEIQPRPNSSGLLDFVLDRETLDKARTDHADLRLYNNAGREIPYVLRIRSEVEVHSAFTAREFNRGVEGAAAQVSCDLGEQPQEHNEVEIETAGNNFRRLADVQGSLDGARWFTLASDAILFRFAADGRSVEQQAVAYPVSRYRYLRVRVNRDPQVDRLPPQIKSLRVRRSMHMKGEMVQFEAYFGGREADRVNARPASLWRMDLGGRVPVQRLNIVTGSGAFSRPFQLEEIDDPSAPTVIASGDLTRRDGEVAAQLTVDFTEHLARRLKLTVTDDRNGPLTIAGISVESPARQVIFEAASAGAGPIRLYYGNLKALAPHYDLGARIPADLTVPPDALTLQGQRDNPVYRPEPKPLSERSPWLVYVVLAAASLALAAILVNLARVSARRAPAL
ncbi:MAG TPA: DUF3999 family protein [Bryobacteraceae bacterium]